MKANWKERRREYLTANGRYRDLAMEGLSGLAIVESAGGRVPVDAAERSVGGKRTDGTTQRVMLNVKDQDRAGGAVRRARLIDFPSNFQ
jgi:hypothetical protein